MVLLTDPERLEGFWFLIGNVLKPPPATENPSVRASIVSFRVAECKILDLEFTQWYLVLVLPTLEHVAGDRWASGGLRFA